MLIIFSKSYKEDDILKYIEKTKSIPPYRCSNNKKLYIIDNLVIKVFTSKSFVLKGLYAFIISKILAWKRIKIPVPVFYYTCKNKEYFCYEKIEGIEVIEFLRRKNHLNLNRVFIERFKAFLKDMLSKNIYHKDFDPTNIIVDKNFNFYLIDIESIIPFSFSRKRKIKMVNELNKFFLRDFGFIIDKNDVIL